MEQSRPPIVTILGHVDHGKTTLLDYIRKSSVAAKEHGGITQHIGAYQVRVGSSELGVGDKESPNAEHRTQNSITFIDTPGHAAFEKMRSRGARVADIAVLVVAFDDGVMPQTIEAIKHIKEAKVSIIVAVNKIDLPGIDKKVQLQKIKKQLSDNQVLVEEYGGDVPIIEVSAKTGEGVDKLLEMILLMAEVNELKGDPNQSPQGVIIEANIDKSKGSVATLLIREGTLKKGDQVVIGGVKGKIRGMFDYAGKSLDSAGPSTPVEILGLESVPNVGAILGGESSGEARSKSKAASLIDKLRAQETSTLNVIVKADKQGSLEAIQGALDQFNTEGEVVKVLATGTGEITEADIKHAAATRAIVLGFNVKLAPAIHKLAETEQVLVRTYNIIYELIDEMQDVVEGMLKAGALEEIFGSAQILAEFPYGKNERIAGCRVVDGQITRGPKVRVVRKSETDEIVGETKIKSLKKGKEEVTRVEKGQECGMMFEPQVDFKVGDIILSYRTL